MKYTDIDKNLEKFYKKLYKKYPENDAVRDYIRARYIYYYYMKIEYQHVHVEWDMARAFHEFNANYLKKYLPRGLRRKINEVGSRLA